MLTHYSKKPRVHPSLKRCENNRVGQWYSVRVLDPSHVHLAVGITAFLAGCARKTFENFANLFRTAVQPPISTLSTHGWLGGAGELSHCDYSLLHAKGWLSYRVLIRAYRIGT